MSTLHDAIRQRLNENAPKSARFASMAEARTLLISARNGKRWVFPWANLVAVGYEDEGGDGKLLFSFIGYEVLLEGTRLDLLLPEISSYRLKSVCEQSENFEGQVAKPQAFISRLSVKKLNGRDQAEVPDGGQSGEANRAGRAELRQGHGHNRKL